MHRLIMSLGLMVLCPVFALAYNETVVAIAYNPSRLGAYQFLKATRAATLGGGLQINKDATLNLQTKESGHISLSSSVNQCGENCDNVHQIGTIEPVASALSSETAVKSENLRMQKRVANKAPVISYTYDNEDSQTFNGSAVSTWGTDVTMNGGTLSARGHSLINQLEATAEKLDINVTEKITITGQATADTLQLGKITLNPGDVTPGTNWKWCEYAGTQVLGYE